MNCHLILDIHLIKLINAANSMVCKHKSSCFNAELTRFRVSSHISSQSSCTTGSSTAVNGTWEELADVLEELTFCSRRVTYDANVDVAPQLDSIISFLFNTAK